MKLIGKAYYPLRSVCQERLFRISHNFSSFTKALRKKILDILAVRMVRIVRILRIVWEKFWELWEKWDELMERKFFVRFEWLDAILFIIGLILSILIVYAPFVKLDYVPDAVKGLTTLTSILAGFIPFLINYALSTTKNEEFKKWLRKRLVGTVFVLAFGLFFVFTSYISLVEGNLVSSYKAILIGCLIISLLFIDTSLVSLLEKYIMSDNRKSIEKL